MSERLRGLWFVCLCVSLVALVWLCVISLCVFCLVVCIDFKNGKKASEAFKICVATFSSTNFFYRFAHFRSSDILISDVGIFSFVESCKQGKMEDFFDEDRLDKMVPAYRKGDAVILHSLNKVEYNGKTGTVAADCFGNGRVGIRLEDVAKPLALKQANIVLSESFGEQEKAVQI